MSAIPQSQIAVLPDRLRAIVAPQGEIDLATVPPVEREVVALSERGFGEICLDLRAVTFFDSSGLRMLIRLDERLRADGGRLTLAAGDGVVARLLRLTRLDARFATPARPLP